MLLRVLELLIPIPWIWNTGTINDSYLYPDPSGKISLFVLSENIGNQEP